MIKSEFFTAALVVPGLAYGGNPSADLPVQIVPAGSDPAIPAEAKAEPRECLYRRTTVRGQQ